LTLTPYNEAFEERAAIIEYCSELSLEPETPARRKEAERLARILLQKKEQLSLEELSWQQ